MAAEVGEETAITGGSKQQKGAHAQEWPLWKLCLIALPQLGVQVLWCFIGPQSANYMKHLGMGDALATLNNIAGPITGFFTGPIVGATSDTLTSRFGRRRPVIVAGLISTWIASMLFSGAEHFMPTEQAALYFAAPMYWVMDVTINILQTPHRALVSDLASEHQQIPMQVVFVFYMAVGNFLGYSIMGIYPDPVDHMFTILLGICLFNLLCIGIQFSVARETPLQKDPDAPKQSACAPVLSVVTAVRSSPRLLYHLAFVQCLVWIGNTCWNNYGAQWFGYSVFQGDGDAEKGSPKKLAYEDGLEAFGHGGQMKSFLQLFSALFIMLLLLKTTIRPRFVYAPCIYIGGAACLLAAFVVGHNGTFAMFCMMLSIMPETGSFAIPFGLVATLNKRAEEEGKTVSTALQMSLLNCCVTVGQQICTVTLASIESQMSIMTALPLIMVVAAAAQAIAGTSALFLDDKPPGEEGSSSEINTSEESSEEQSSSDA